MSMMIPLIPAVLITLALIFSTCLSETETETETFIYVGCTQQKYEAGSPYEGNLNSVLTSLVSSASLSNFNKLKSEEVSGVFQCRGDLSKWECERCVANAVSRIGTYCVGTCGGALQLEGCFIKYDNTSFLGAQDKGVVWSKCGGAGGGGDAVLTYLVGGGGGGGGGGQYFQRVEGGMVECVQDLSMDQCGDCLSEAIRRLRTECATSAWGNMFLGKCYARFSLKASSRSPDDHYSKGESSDENDETEKTLALIIGLIAGVALLIIFLSFLSKNLDGK